MFMLTKTDFFLGVGGPSLYVLFLLIVPPESAPPFSRYGMRTPVPPTSLGEGLGIKQRHTHKEIRVIRQEIAECQFI